MHGVVEVRGGRVRGVERDGIWTFSGVPYAASPAGERRWRPPAPPEPWAGIRDCDRFGPVAPQAMGFMDQALSGGGSPPESDEDCLNLNVWTPGLDGGRRPVMVWVHGGSFMTGTGSSGLYRGGHLARTEDVVVVTINYRLGLLGFLAHPALDDPGQTWLDGREWTGSGNWGLADQVAALVWVRDHIATFGGDPGNVTLFGESAGGMSVSALLAVPAAAGLFHRAVVESGPPYTCALEVATERAERLAAHLGVPCTRASLAGVPAEQLVAAGTELRRGRGRCRPPDDPGRRRWAPGHAARAGGGRRLRRVHPPPDRDQPGRVRVLRAGQSQADGPHHGRPTELGPSGHPGRRGGGPRGVHRPGGAGRTAASRSRPATCGRPSPPRWCSGWGRRASPTPTPRLLHPEWARTPTSSPGSRRRSRGCSGPVMRSRSRSSSAP